jgi:ornithine cyclodeaminase
VTEFGAVLAGAAPRRRDDGEITIFDSTGLAIQNLAALEREDELDDLQRLSALVAPR